jgi:hypothetical protein
VIRAIDATMGDALNELGGSVDYTELARLWAERAGLDPGALG